VPAIVFFEERVVLWENGDGCARLLNLPRYCISDPSSSFYGFDPFGVPIQDCQIEAIAQKLVVLGGKVLLDSRQILREGL
jgi:hypothetical protein